MCSMSTQFTRSYHISRVAQGVATDCLLFGSNLDRVWEKVSGHLGKGGRFIHAGTQL